MSSDWKKTLKNIPTEGLPFGLFCGSAMVVVALWFAWYSMAESLENYRLSKWHAVECDIISSKIEEGEDGTFEVRYGYEWQNDSFENDRYRIGWDSNDILNHSEAIELAQKYKAGNRDVCYVNPDEPNEAVLSRSEPRFLGYMVIPAFLLVVGVRQICLGLKRFMSGGVPEDKNADIDDVHVDTSASRRVVTKMWKYLTGFGFVLALVLNLPLALLVSVFLYGATVALAEAIQDMRKKLIKVELNVSGKIATRDVVGKKVHFTIFEKVVLIISLAVYLVIMVFVARHNRHIGPFALFGVLFSGLWLGGLMFGMVWLIIATMHGYHYIALQEKKKETGYSKFDLPVWSLLASNLVVIVWAIVERWSFHMIIWVYWGQSLCIGLFLLIRALALREIVDDLGGPARKRKKTSKMLGFLFIYALFHGAYVAFLKVFFKDANLGPKVHWVIILAAGIFFVQQIVTFVYDCIRGGGRTDIDNLIGLAGLRIVPMHLTIMGAGFLSEVAGFTMQSPVILVLFLGLKAFADVETCLYTRKGYSKKMDAIFEQ